MITTQAQAVHEHVYDDATGQPCVCPVDRCWFNDDGTTRQDGYTADSYGLPEDTETGIRCGNHPRDLGIRHENVAAVRACYAVVAELEAQQRAEIYAEAGMSWVAGGGSADDARIYASVIASGRSWDEYLTGR